MDLPHQLPWSSTSWPADGNIAQTPTQEVSSAHLGVRLGRKRDVGSRFDFIGCFFFFSWLFIHVWCSLHFWSHTTHFNYTKTRLFCQHFFHVKEVGSNLTTHQPLRSKPIQSRVVTINETCFCLLPWYICGLNLALVTCIVLVTTSLSG